NNEDLTINFVSDSDTGPLGLPTWWLNAGVVNATVPETGQRQPISTIFPKGTWLWVDGAQPVQATEVNVASDVPESGSTLMLAGMGLVGCGLLKLAFPRLTAPAGQG